MPEILGRLRSPRLAAGPASPAQGEQYYDTVAKKLYYWDGTAWVSGSTTAVEYIYVNGGWGIGQAMSTAWTTMKPTGTPTSLPVGAFTENADGSVTVRDAGYYEMTGQVLFNPLAQTCWLTIGATPGGQGYYAEELVLGTTATGQILNASATGYVAAGTTMCMTARMGAAGATAVHHGFQISRVGAGPQGLQGPQGPAGPSTPITVVTSLPSSPVDGQEVYYRNANSPWPLWHLRYDSSWSDAYKWDCLGGAPLVAEVAANETVTPGASYIDTTTVGPQVTLPLAGDYDLSFGALLARASTGAAISYAALTIGATALDAESVYFASPADAAATAKGASVERTIRGTGLAAGKVVKLQYKSSAGNSNVQSRWLQARPVRVG